MENEMLLKSMEAIIELNIAILLDINCKRHFIEPMATIYTSPFRIYKGHDTR